MTLTLMANFEDDNDEVFPKTDVFLFIGGPKHGQRLEVPRDEMAWKVFARPQAVRYSDDNEFPMLAGSQPEVNTYVRRDLGFEDPDTRDTYVKSVFMHEAIPNAEVAQRLLMAALLAEFVKSGRKVVNQDARRFAEGN